MLRILPLFWHTYTSKKATEDITQAILYRIYYIKKKQYLNINPNLFMLQAFIQVRKSLNHMVIYVQQNAPTNTPSSFQTVKLKLIFTLSVSLSNCERPLTLPNTFSNNLFFAFAHFSCPQNICCFCFVMFGFDRLVMFNLSLIWAVCLFVSCTSFGDAYTHCCNYLFLLSLLFSVATFAESGRQNESQERYLS